MWSGRSCWHVFSELPVREGYEGKEAPYSCRAWQVRPGSVTGESLLKSFGVGAVNMKGVKGFGDKSVGQDCCSISVLPSGWHVYCLFDGHGDGGHWPAQRASRTLPYLLEATQACSTMLKQDSVEAALYHAFEKVQMDLVRQSVEQDFELQVCGSTAVCVLQHPRHHKVWAAYLGDSRAVLIVPGKGAVAQTMDHKPSVESERARLEGLGVDIQRKVHEDGFVEERLFIQGEDFPGLCMTRSLGDLCVKDHGVTAEPEVLSWNTSDYPDSYVLIASDGIWDCFTSDEMSEFETSLQTRGFRSSLFGSELVHWFTLVHIVSCKSCFFDAWRS